jgi:hypothetical protein
VRRAIFSPSASALTAENPKSQSRTFRVLTAQLPFRFDTRPGFTHGRLQYFVLAASIHEILDVDFAPPRDYLLYMLLAPELHVFRMALVSPLPNAETWEYQELDARQLLRKPGPGLARLHVRNTSCAVDTS